MIPKKKAQEVLRALQEKKERDGLEWKPMAEEMGLTARTLQHSMEWLREGCGEEYGHRPSRKTVKAILKWLRERGVFLGSA